MCPGTGKKGSPAGTCECKKKLGEGIGAWCPGTQGDTRGEAGSSPERRGYDGDAAAGNGSCAFFVHTLGGEEEGEGEWPGRTKGALGRPFIGKRVGDGGPVADWDLWDDTTSEQHGSSTTE